METDGDLLHISSTFPTILEFHQERPLENTCSNPLHKELGRFHAGGSLKIFHQHHCPPSSGLVLGASGGEVVRGSRGIWGDFLTPGRGAASVVEGAMDSLEVEEMFSEFDEVGSEVEVKTEVGAVRLIFPLYNHDEGTVEQWSWNVCGGLIGGP